MPGRPNGYSRDADPFNPRLPANVVTAVGIWCEQDKFMGIKVFNTMTREVEPLTTNKPRRVEFFVCGPTVYDFSHLGHAKTYTQFDFIVKYIRARGYEVVYAQNITDVDDRIIDRANQRGLSPADLAAEFEKYYIEDMTALHNDSVNVYARAHNYIDQIVDQISRLIEKGYAYRITDGYYFDLTKFRSTGNYRGAPN
jgi:cysteinyl-tRNA synthetase